MLKAITRREDEATWTAVADERILGIVWNWFIHMRQKDEKAGQPWRDGVPGSDLKEQEVGKARGQLPCRALALNITRRLLCASERHQVA